MTTHGGICGSCARAKRRTCECPFHGEALAEIMLVRDVSRATLSRETGITCYRLRLFETGKDVPGAIARALLAGILGVPSRYFSRQPEPLPEGPIFFCATNEGRVHDRTTTKE